MRQRYEPNVKGSSLNDQIDDMLQKENEAFLRFVKASRKHTMSISTGTYILYVEDDPDSQSLLKTLIEHSCNEIQADRLRLLTAFTIKEAQRKINDYFDRMKLIITDLDFGKGYCEGIDFLHWVDKEFKGALPVIVLTGRVELVDTLREKFSNIEVLIKPMSKEKLLRAITQSEEEDV